MDDTKQELLNKMKERQKELSSGLSVGSYHLACIDILFEVAAEYLSKK